MPAITTYVSAAEIKASKTGFDFSGYADEVLEVYGELAKGIIDNYCGR